ncbi:uncharacterized protein MONBRDRAFT_11415 [Monosiga brevicollis MX1]|uniref:Uncharacterized protein n=1 Tax=Monosiga brevicollis TaxID=81824 RepID=A9V970_MONBE|nr:uncharacterized protein MONBRDRAFT_11415 [Monosiga brevicollis MX1]EDQ86007.1 predicted protein [Monosiga brevicollis MX1]|eukprot:XP_001749201.1 hypothetical protein [Monosiga brevicollis MX1]
MSRNTSRQDSQFRPSSTDDAVMSRLDCQTRLISLQCPTKARITRRRSTLAVLGLFFGWLSSAMPAPIATELPSADLILSSGFVPTESALLEVGSRTCFLPDDNREQLQRCTRTEIKQQCGLCGCDRIVACYDARGNSCLRLRECEDPVGGKRCIKFKTCDNDDYDMYRKKVPLAAVCPEGRPPASMSPFELRLLAAQIKTELRDCELIKPKKLCHYRADVGEDILIQGASTFEFDILVKNSRFHDVNHYHYFHNVNHYHNIHYFDNVHNVLYFDNVHQFHNVHYVHHDVNHYHYYHHIHYCHNLNYDHDVHNIHHIHYVHNALDVYYARHFHDFCDIDIDDVTFFSWLVFIIRFGILF